METLKNVIEAVGGVILLVMLLIGAVSALVGTMALPIIMVKLTGSLWWLVGYLGYCAGLWVFCNIAL